MRSTPNRPPARGRVLLPHLGVVAALFALSVTACDYDDILAVDDPDKATIDDITDPENLPAVRAHGIGEFQVAYAGRGAAQDNSFILMTGMLADEYQLSGSFPTRQEVDMRAITRSNATTQQTFRLMHRARRAAEISAELHGEHEPETRPHAEAHVLTGFMYNAFAEMYCSGVAFSALPLEDPVEEFGEPMTTAEMLQTAVQWFNDGLTLSAAAGADLEAAASAVGLGRALLNLGEFEAAAGAVSAVPTDFAYNVNHSAATARQWNGTWNFVNSVQRWRIADQAGGNGLPYRTLGTQTDAAGNVIVEGDPRVTWFEDGVGFDQVTTQYSQLKYPTNDAPSPIATGIEARLIEAEAALQMGNTDGFLQIHNDLRATQGMEALDGAGMTDDDLVDLHFQERGFWLWQTGHRLGDLRRLVRQYGRDAETVFPTGAYFKGGSYGTDVNFPIPIDEDNNPNAVACFDRGA